MLRHIPAKVDDRPVGRLRVVLLLVWLAAIGAGGWGPVVTPEGPAPLRYRAVDTVNGANGVKQYAYHFLDAAHAAQ
jgi:hypothetical protein